MAWTEKDIPDLSGRTAVVTGANGGLGYQTTLALAGAGAHVVVAARDPEKTASATARIRERYPAASLEVVPLDLGDLSVVSTAADDRAGRARAHRPPGEQRRRDGHAAADHGRRLRDAARRRPPGSLGVHRAPAPGPAARPGGPRGHRDQHRPLQGRPAGPGGPAHAEEVPGVGLLRAGQDGQLPLRAGACSSTSTGPGLGGGVRSSRTRGCRTPISRRARSARAAAAGSGAGGVTR